MALYTERHNMRKPIEHTSTISIEMYSMLYDCCEKYYNNIAWKFPEQCSDGHGCCGLDLQQFNIHMKFDIPSLYRNSYGSIDKPSKNHFDKLDEYDQYALLDLIEFIGQNCKDVKIGSYHNYFAHYHLDLQYTNHVGSFFGQEINGIFQKTGLLYKLSDKMIIERIIENNALSTEMETVIKSVKEKGLKDLVEEAIMLFKQPNPTTRNNAVEKLWDAFERLKTYYTTLDKKASAKKIVKDMSNGQQTLEQLFDDEFTSLTKMGNEYRIRHHETNKVDIQDIRHYDYFFNRCLALITSAIQYLE